MLYWGLTTLTNNSPAVPLARELVRMVQGYLAFADTATLFDTPHGPRCLELAVRQNVPLETMARHWGKSQNWPEAKRRLWRLFGVPLVVVSPFPRFDYELSVYIEKAHYNFRTHSWIPLSLHVRLDASPETIFLPQALAAILLQVDDVAEAVVHVFQELPLQKLERTRRVLQAHGLRMVVYTHDPRRTGFFKMRNAAVDWARPHGIEVRFR